MNRLQRLASLTKGSKFVCDVGCDHGYTLIEALKYYGVLKGIASDINEGPLLQAKRNICKNNLEDRITCVLSDGFLNVKDFFDTAIISGMGGILITNILSKSKELLKDKKLIIQPNSDRELVRRYLSENGFNIVDEYAFYDSNKYYEIIVAEPGKSNYSNLELKYGPINLIKKEEAFIDYYNNQINNLNKMIKNISNEKILNEKKNELDEIKMILGAK